MKHNVSLGSRRDIGMKKTPERIWIKLFGVIEVFAEGAAAIWLGALLVAIFLILTKT